MIERTAQRQVTLLGEVNGVLMIEPTPEHHELVGDCTKISVGVSFAGVELFSMPCTLSHEQTTELIGVLNVAIAELAKRSAFA